MSLSRSSLRHQVRRRAADHAGRSPLRGLDGDRVAQHHLVEPAAERGEPDEALVGDVLDHEADLVHVGRQHDAGRFALAGLLADQAPQVVRLELADARQARADEGADLVLEAGHAVSWLSFSSSSRLDFFMASVSIRRGGHGGDHPSIAARRPQSRNTGVRKAPTAWGFTRPAGRCRIGCGARWPELFRIGRNPHQ